MRPIRVFILSVTAILLSASAFAQFSPGPNPITGTVGAQTLSAGTGTVNAGGAISIPSGGNVALTMTGTSTLVNNGTIQTTGTATGRAIDSNSGIASLTVTNNGLISAVSTDAFRVNTNSAVSLTNNATIQVTNGGQAIDWAAITSKTNSLVNSSTGVITAVGEDAVRPGTNGTVNNVGTITATPTGGANPSGSDGIDLRTFTGIQVTNTGSVSGRSGIATDSTNVASILTVNNNAGTIAGINGSGINVDGANTNVTANVTNLLGATIRGGVLAVATNGDGDGIDVDGILILNNSGDVLGYGAKGVGGDTLPNNPEGVAAGGGSITNAATGRIIGSALAADAPNGDTSRLGSGILIDNSSGGNAVAATSITNSGLIQGTTGFAIKIIDTFDDTITNNGGGTIRGGAAQAALQTGGGDDTVTNRGAIVGDQNNALDLGDGNDTLRIEGGLASILGRITGGTGTNTVTIDPGLGNTFCYSGAMSQFATLDIMSGVVSLSGANTFIQTANINGGNLRLDGADRLLLDSSGLGSNIVMNGGLLEFASAGLGQTFNSFSLTGDSTLDLDFSSVTFNLLGTIDAGTRLTIIDFLNPGTFRFLGDLTSNADFLTLMADTTIRGASAVFGFDGIYTTVDGVPDAVPEPSTIVLVGLACLAVIGRSRVARRAGHLRCRD
jgi:hypothetical protein